MAKKKVNDIIPEKVIINFKPNGTYDSAILVYRIKEESGEISSKIYTMKVNTQISTPVISGILSNIKSFVKQKEKAFNS